MRFRRERAELSTKVESRVKKAEINRMQILKAHKQRRLSLKERTSQSLLRRMTRESKYKERVRAAIHQKRAAAEKKRLGLLEAETKRAGARILQVRKVAKCISRQREIERQDMQSKLENRLQRAKRQRAEYLMQRGKGQNSVRSSWNKFQEEADLLSRKLARCWRQFRKIRETTLQLAKSYDALNINKDSVTSKPFEQLALMIESGSTLQTTKALLDRFECRYVLARMSAATPHVFAWGDIDHLLKRVATPRRRATPRKSTASRETRKPGPLKQSPSPKTPVKLSRYQVRIVLCAYMILGHPSSVFSGRGEREIALAQSAETFVREFELLIKTVLDGPVEVSNTESGPVLVKFRYQLAAFDSAWCSYLNNFVMWKVKDAESLEGDLVRAACHLELSMIQTCRMTPEGDSGSLTHDMKAIQKQVTQDQKLLREKVHNLSGDAGIARMEAAISDTRAKYFQALENGSPVGSSIAQITSPISASIPTPHPRVESVGKSNGLTENAQKPNVARRLFGDEGDSNGSGMWKDLENELIVNESVHGEQLVHDENINFGDKIQSSAKEKVKETMKKAFWDGIIESVEQDEPKFGHILELMKEVRDEISLMAPESWKQEIFESIDIEILSQVLSAGNVDMDYLGKVLGFALVKLQKLSAPASTDELEATHQKFMEELATMCQENGPSKKAHTVALVKGLRFVLEQIQILKQEVSKYKIQFLQPVLKGPAGLAFLRKSFTKHYGAPGDSVNTLPLTREWLLSIRDCKDQEWSDHCNILSESAGKHGTIPERSLAPTTLKSGGHFPNSRSGNPDSLLASISSLSYSDCKGKKVDLMVRLGLLKLVSEISGVTQESLPETQKLNVLRLRAVQARMQKITVIATSILVLQQTLVSERIVISHGDIDNIVLSCVKQLSDLLDTFEDAGISELAELLSQVVNDVDNSIDESKRQSLKDIMARMLTKSLQAGDPIFSRISRAIYLAARCVVLSGSGTHGRELAAIALRQVGAISLVDELVSAATVLAVAATVSVDVHGPWYVHLVDNM
ncbi:OLC1v1002390C1 [Oldenlandia corymbosa var. corymbosa]|nr:OLC1v1002390C1 [Oldenlandia corymbosa var. corymbosa]